MPCHQLPPWPVPTVILLESGGVALEVLAVVGRFRVSFDRGINRGLISSVVTVALGVACHQVLGVLAERSHVRASGHGDGRGALIHLCDIAGTAGAICPAAQEHRVNVSPT